MGLKSGSFTINSDDPDEPVITIPITGSASLDNDRVPTAIEDLAPDNGDGNNDGIKDSVQSNVFSIETHNGLYITTEVADTMYVSDFILHNEGDMVKPPENIQTAFEYNLRNLPLVLPGTPNIVQVGLYLPVGNVPSTFYIYGPTESNTNPHWFEFDWDGFTGAQILGNVTVVSPQGDRVNKSLVRLVFIDGGRGDSDLSVNGRINVYGSPLLPENINGGSSSAGGLKLMTIMCLLSVLVFFRKVSVNSQ